MIYNNKTKKYTKQNWKENFRIELPRIFFTTYTEGSVIPRFYLPVLASPYKYSMELWIFPLAPFVWLWRVIKDVLWLIWHDLIEWQREIKALRSMKDNHHDEK